jgi:hypothetical protein
MKLDFFKQPLNEGDCVAFPSSGSMMLGIIEKFRFLKSRKDKTVYRVDGFVRNSSGNKKWKDCRDLVKCPESFKEY